MKNAIGLLLLLTAVTLSGCKATVETEVTVLDLFYSKTRMIPADFYTEVADCADAATARGAEVSAVFADADYIGCARDGGASLAHFRIQIALDKDPDGKLASDDHINLVSTEDAFLVLTIPAALKERLATPAGLALRAAALPIDVQIRIKNDYGNAIPIQVFSVYVDGKPFLFGDTTLPEAGDVVLRLSEVAIDHAIESGSSVLLMREKKQDS
ncbi:hypothetical protein Thimo_1445 [Thioflavicoccus mobilis 8321]|uniref:DUF7424 domain-containing protein n=1 Tax=Thioflavicoccus mobilis 8321 TaxID=765912 RepID=L0GXX8_9GAMM|nr:hypothetical protein [Thioflavicoccus mobilis]AGA90235.1 hypothetical protein Thimo_1445 [Thioflavicoccus mobilis 8321]